MRDLTDAMAHIIATNIKNLRVGLGHNQTEFAETLGVSQGTIARWEAGASPKYDALLKLSELAGVSAREFSNSLISGARDGDRGEVMEVLAAPIMLPVLLPSEEALAAMFRGLLGVVAEENDRAVAARRLAQLLPDALARTVFRSSAHPIDPDVTRALEEDAQPPSRANPAPPR